VLLQIVREDWRSFDAVNVATALHQLGACRAMQPPLLNSVVSSPEFATLKEQVGWARWGGWGERIRGVPRRYSRALLTAWLLPGGMALHCLLLAGGAR
jgi:hypothetical protein